MAIITQPAFLPEPFANTGSKNIIPDTLATPTASAAASWAAGFPSVTSLPLAAGGIAPARDDFNGVFNALSAHAFWAQSGSPYTWSQELNYTEHSRAVGSDGTEYLATSSNGPDTVAGAINPVGDTTGTWVINPGVWMEAFRRSWIGVPRPWRSTTLPTTGGFMWADGSFATFADWPELETVYTSGGFSGMLLPYNASAATIAANLGAWRPNAATPSGLYLPNLSGQFMRAWTSGYATAAGSANTDTGRNATGFIDGNLDITSSGGVFSRTNYAAGPATGAAANTYHQAVFNLETVWGTEHAAGEFAPVHVMEPYIIYLGRATA